MIAFSARDLTGLLDSSGYLSALSVCGQPVLKRRSPLVSLCRGERALLPVAMAREGDRLLLRMEDDSRVEVCLREQDACVTLEALALPEDARAIVFGPLYVAPDESVGDVIGVARGQGVAVGLMALNAKTIEGVPRVCAPDYLAMADYLPTDTGVSTGGMELYERAATRLRGGGTVLHLYCRDRTREEYAPVVGAPQAWVLPMRASDPDARIPGAKALLFGCRAEEALLRIGEIELAQGLPHPLIDGEWVKTSREAMQSYLISDFSANDVDLVLDKAQLAGMRTIYHADPFRAWGHFLWREDLAADDEDFKRRVVDRATARGLKVGLHTLTNFTTTNDPYVTPVPSEHLLKLAHVPLLADADETDDTLLVASHVCFSVAQTLNAVQMGEELVTFVSAEVGDTATRLTGLTRGAFGTVVAPHRAGEQAFLLRDYPYQTLFPDLTLQDRYADRIVELFNRTGAAQISFDGYEGCSYTGHDLYAPTRFLMRCYNGFDHFVLNDGSGLHHFGWHVNTRMNWGEPWGEAMRAGQVESRIRNQDFFARNLFPRMLGWFLLRLAERKFECSMREDLEWALSKAAGFDAGYAMSVSPAVLRRHGRIDELLGLIREWDILREQGAFTEEQKARLRCPENEFRLEKQADGGYTLYPLGLSRPYTCALSEMQPGQSGGADWVVENEQEPSFAFRLRVDGDGEIRQPMFKGRLGAIRFPCTICDGQYLIFDLDGTARVTDRNLNLVQEVSPVGSALLPRGSSALAFSCEHARGETPDVQVRFITRGIGEPVAR